MLSIITNFGCDVGCEYCIWKQHLLKKHKTSLASTNWQFLKQAIKGQSRISVSGGGDPFFNLQSNLNWWERLYSLKPIKTGQTLVDVHTAKIAPSSFLKQFPINKYVLHIKDIWHFQQLVPDLLELPVASKRVVIVADTKLKKDDYTYISRELMPFNVDFSIRQKVINNKAVQFNEDFFEQELGWKYIKQADYNTYFMPDNNVYKKFLLT